MYRMACLAIILLSFALRVHNLGERSLWFDESMEFWVAMSPLGEILPAAKSALQDPPLYSLLLHFWLKIGYIEFSVRFLSLIFSLGGILAVITLSRLAFGRAASLVAGLLMAVAIPDIRYAQEAGQYALMSFVLGWNLVFLYLSIKRASWQAPLLWGISIVAVGYSYYGAALIVAATTAVSFVYMVVRRQWGNIGKIMVAGTLGTLLLIPLVVGWMPEQLFRGPTADAFQFSFGATHEELQRLFAHVKVFFIFQFLGNQAGWPWPQVGESIIWLPVVWLLGVGLIRHKLALPVLWFIVGLAFHYVIGRLGAYPFGGRHSLIMAPLLWTYLGAGIVALVSHNRLISWRNVVALLPLGLFFLIAFVAPIEPQTDLRSVTRFWLSQRDASEVTYVYYGAVPGFRYQLEVAGHTENVPSVWYRDCWQGKPVRHCADQGIFYGRWIRRLEPDQKREAVLELIDDSAHRFWLIFSHIFPEEDVLILSTLGDSYSIVTSYVAENSAAYLLERR
jgi:uncharacterized membrane protein